MEKKKIMYAAGAVVALGLVASFFLKGGPKMGEAKLVTAQVEKASISSVITATGTIEPVTKVEVGTQVSGIIDRIYVDFNSEVKKGQVIAEMDRRNLTSELTNAQSDLTSAQASLNYQLSNYTRYKTLHEKGLISANDYENAVLSYEQAKMTLRSRQENVKKAQQNLGYATITSPIDGVILNKAVEEGQTVAAGFSTPTLFTIAQDLTDMRVIADIDEADIGEVKEGQRVSFSVDAYPNDTFEGQVTQVRQEATTSSNVVTYEVVISAPNQDLKLKPGLTANVTIFTNEKTDVLSVPAKALKFVPTQIMVGPKGQIEDCEGKTKVWTKEGNNFKAHPVKVGVSNGSKTEIISGVAEGTQIIVEADMAGGSADDAPNSFFPGPPGSQNRKK